MFVFAYSKFWADVVVGQLKDQLGGPPETWGYACLCIGRDLDDFIEANYAAMNKLSGDFLHLFSMRPLPRSFLLDRMAHAQRNGDHHLATSLEYQTKHAINAVRQVEEKVELLTDLRRAGMSPSEYADFLFFDFRSTAYDDSTEIDVIAAKAVPKHVGKDTDETIRLFRELSDVAGKCAAEGFPAREFVARATMQWDRDIALSKSLHLFHYVKDFISKVAGR